MPASPWLAIDVGNTRAKWGVGDAGAWVAHGAIATEALADLARALPPLDAGTRVVACCVAGEAAEAALAHACAQRALTVRWVRPAAVLLGVRNGYRQPAQLGADRWAALVAAHADQAMNQLVVAAGTALTIDALGADGRFRGGVIVPGTALMRSALTQGTARLRPLAGQVAALPDNTDDAIATGTVIAACGAIDRMQEAMRLAGAPPGRILLTGGGADELAPWLAPPPTLRTHLVLDGLARIAPTLPWHD